MRPRLLSLSLLGTAMIAVGCGDGDPSAKTGAAKTAAEGAKAKPAEPPPRAAEVAKPTVPRATPLQAAERAKPTVPQGVPPERLVARDLVEGTGAAAKAGEILVVRYVAGIYETGEEIESAGSPSEPIGFLLGSGDWSPGWEEGMQGMRVGGRRVLIFPTSPDVVPPGSELGDTLVYVVDLLEITQPTG